MSTLHLGVFDVPEDSSEMTTFAVAKILEKNYGLYSNFVAMNMDFIRNQITQGLSNSVAVVAAGRVPKAMYGKAPDEITKRFRQQIDMDFLDGKVSGVKTKAAILKKSRTKGKRRSSVSFFDTGILRRNIHTWID